MTEAEWLESSEPKGMLECVREKVSPRKARLIAVACCRSIWHLLKDRRLRRAVEIAERYADGSATDEERDVACCKAVEAGADVDDDNLADAVEHASHPSRNEDHIFDASETAYFAAQAVGSAADDEGEDFDAALEAQHARQCNLLRDILGNPFRPATIEQDLLKWHDGTAVKIAQGIYEDRAFDRLPILADALEEAGCDNADILAHCRQPGEHVRGCWVVDLILGKD